METLAPASRRGQVLLYMVVTLSLAVSLVDGDSSSCTPTINMARHNKFEQSPGQSLILKCPMRLCYLGLPNVTWCKIIGDVCDLMRTGEGIYSSMEERREDNAVYVLKFESVKVNDTGYYRCRAVFKEQQVVGSTIEIAISGEHVAANVTATNITRTGNTTDSSHKFQTFTKLLYIMSSVGGACVLIIAVSLLIYCKKHVKGKHRSSQNPAPTEELKFVARPGSLKNCHQQKQGGSPTPTDPDQTAVEVTYDNAHLGYKSTTQKIPKEEEDSIVYADLNHNAKKTSFHFEDDCEVEYATVHLSESRKNDM